MVVGVIFSFLASVCFNASNVMEKRAVDRMVEFSARRSGHMIRVLLTSRLWIAGFIVSLVGLGFMVIGFSLTPIAVVQTIFGAGLVILVFASRVYLKESIGRRELAGLGAIVVAIVLVSLSLSSSTTPGIGGTSRSLLLTSLVTTIAAVLCFIALRPFPMDASVTFGVTSGLFYGVGALATKSASVIVTEHGVVDSIPKIIASPYPYVFVVASVLGLLTFQTGLQRCRIAMVGPLTNVIASTYVVIVGMVLFNEPLPRNTSLTVLRFVGFALVLIGSCTLAGNSSASA